MKNLLWIGLFAYGTAASAANTLLEVPITYHPQASVAPHVKAECKIEDKLSQQIGTMLAKLNRTGDGTVAAGVDTAGAALLRVQITHVLGVGGGAWSGPKAVTVDVDLLENGKVTRHTHINRWTTGGMWGGFKGTCSLLDRNIAAIAKDLQSWVRDPSYKIVEEAAPKADPVMDPAPKEAPAAAKENPIPPNDPAPAAQTRPE